MLSFGPPEPFATVIKAAGACLICQVQTMAHTRAAVASGADIIVAQGSEAGGHGQSRTTFTLVPEIADYLAKAAPETILVAAGGVADGRGLAAALMLGAEGVLIGSRFMMSDEALVPAGLHEAVARASGDATVRTAVLDVVRQLEWPPEHTGRALRTRFVEDWHGREAELAQPVTMASEVRRYMQARDAGDMENTGIFVGEAAGLLNDVRPAGDILRDMVAQAEQLLTNRRGLAR
jgi:nitronate monooxygenase